MSENNKPFIEAIQNREPASSVRAKLNQAIDQVNQTPEDAPQDGKIYGRKNGEWIELISPQTIPTFSKGSVTIENELSFVDLDDEYDILLSVSIGRIMIHENVDFIKTTVAGVSRLTWIGSLSNPDGDESVEEGFVVYYSGVKTN